MRLFFPLLLFFLIQSCQNKVPQLNNLSSNRYAQHFSIITNADSSITLKVINPYQGAINDTFVYQLSCQKSSSKTIHIPVKKIVIFSTTYIGFLEALDESASIIGISGTNMVYNTDIIEKIHQKHIYEAGFENSINYEMLASSKPDVVFIYTVGKETMPYVEKIQSLGIPVVYVAEFMEDNPLGRAEWINFFGAFFQKTKLSASIFRNVEANYDSINQLAQSITYHPLIFLNIPYQGIWYMPAGNSYMANLIKDAGGNYIYQSQSNNKILKFDFEKILTDAINADIWLNTGQLTSKNELSQIDQRYSLFKAYRNNSIYNHTLRINTHGGNDFWESGAVYPNLILEDLFHIFKNDSNFTFHYYQKLK